MTGQDHVYFRIMLVLLIGESIAINISKTMMKVIGSTILW